MSHAVRRQGNRPQGICRLADSRERDGIYTLGRRSEAEVFHTCTDAAIAITKMSQPLKAADITCLVEFAD